MRQARRHNAMRALATFTMACLGSFAVAYSALAQTAPVPVPSPQIGPGLTLRAASPQAAPPIARSSIVYPRQELPLRFSHVEHLERDVACQRCHEKIESSASGLDNNLPRESSCSTCHIIERGIGSGKAASTREVQAQGEATPCKTCHLDVGPGGAIARTRMPVPNLKFSHKAHLARGSSCEACHGQFVTGGVGLATRDQLPTMQTCLGCHDGKQAPESCRTCHLSQVGGLLKTEFPGLGQLAPSGQLRGAAHDMGFVQSHKYAAQNDQGFCASCHQKEYCVDCHSGIQKPMEFHAGDYVNMHAIEARRNSPDCSSCHRLQTFCQGCHSRLGVANDGKGSDEFGPGALYHPPGWSEPGLVERGPNHHSFEAQRNIKQCASCHRESFCTRCHSNQANSLRVNPHPRDWVGSRRCEALVKRTPRMCLRCHVEAIEPSCDRR